MAMIDFTQIKNGKNVVDQVNGLVAKTDVVDEAHAGTGTPADDKVLSEAAVEARLSTVKAGFSRHAEDEVVLEGASATTEFNVSCVPTDDKLVLSVNGVVYVEDKHFTVDRSAKKVTWMYTAANGGFDLNEALTDNVKLVYLTREPATPPIVSADHCLGMVLVQEGNRTGTWVRVDRDFNTVEFNPEHGTWAGIKQVQNDTYGEFTEIPITYVKTETLQSGPYAGKNCWWIADYPADGFHVHPAFIGQDGQPHNLQIASYLASNKSGTPYSEDLWGNKNSIYWNNISYNDVHAKGWMTGGARPYNIYDHHFLARMMLIEFGTPDVQVQTVDGEAWTSDVDNRINYHGIYDPFGAPEYYDWDYDETIDKVRYWLDGLTTLNGTYQVLAANGSLDMIETGVSCLNATGWITNCRVDQANGINFGDLFIASDLNNSKNLGSFADAQNSSSELAFFTIWDTIAMALSDYGAFYLFGNNPTYTKKDHSWRLALCS